MKPTLDQIKEKMLASSQQNHLKRLLDKLPIEISWAAGDQVFATFGNKSENEVELIAPERIWCEMFMPAPPVGQQSLGAMRRQCKDFKLVGSEMAYLQALPFLEQLIENTREALHGRVPENEEDDLSVLVGNYIQIKSGSWVYQERSGNKNAPTILMLHTAGADTRQWHGLMTIPELNKNWNMVAFDVPGHGRSPMPAGEENWDWHMREERYMQWVIEYIEAAKLKNIVLMGCSMGAAIAIALLANYKEYFSAGVILEAPYRSPGRRSPYLDHPQVHGNRLAAIWVASLLSPLSPKVRRDYAKWIYSQSAPSVYDGDLEFYSDEFAATNHTAKIDAKKTPVWFLTGDYDYSASPEETLKVVAEIPGATFTRLKGFGHFPMTEDPKRLYKEYLAAVLADCAKKI